MQEIIFTELEGGRSGIDKASYGEKSYKLNTTTLNKVLRRIILCDIEKLTIFQ